MQTQNSNNKGKTIVMTGGGTAGHVTPNIALIPHLRAEGFENIHYIGTNGIEKELITKLPDVTYHEIPSGKLRRYFSLKNLTDPFRVIAGVFKAKKLIRIIKPDVVFSKGGFVSVPVVIGAKGISPVVAHESDYTPGLTTKISSRFAKKICVSFEDTVRYLPKGKAVHTGSPIRDMLFEGSAKRGKEIMGFKDDKPVLMVMGGSLGALAVNQAVREALPILLPHFNVAHICGKGKADEAYANTDGYVQFEYVSEDLPHIFAAADIIVSRSGANSVFEFLALCKPSILIPLPSKSSRGDQILNAEYFEKHGYSKVIMQENITPQLLADTVFSMYDERESYIKAMSEESTAKDGTANVINVIMTVTKTNTDR